MPGKGQDTECRWGGPPAKPTCINPACRIHGRKGALAGVLVEDRIANDPAASTLVSLACNLLRTYSLRPRPLGAFHQRTAHAKATAHAGSVRGVAIELVRDALRVSTGWQKAPRDVCEHVLRSFLPDFNAEWTDLTEIDALLAAAEPD